MFVRVLVATLTAFSLAGCAPEQRVNQNATADITAAAEAAQGDIDTYAANALEPTPPPLTAIPPPKPPVTPRATPTPATPDPGDGEAIGNEQAAATDATYRCAGETRISVRFDRTADTATIRRDGRDLAVLEGQRPASGIWYKGGGHELRGTGRNADYTAPDRPPVACTVQ